MEKITLLTTDGVSIAADYYPANGDRFAILLHMMPATKESWHDFAVELQAKGISSIAIDERGHGQSQGGPNGYKKFTDEQQQAKIHDVEAAWQELERRGATPEKTAVVGASIGANLAIEFVSEHKEIPLAIALSPGLDYHGISTRSYIKNLAANQKVLLVASTDDEYSYESITKLSEVNPMNCVLFTKQKLGHGTKMIDKDKELMIQIIEWIDTNL